MKHRIGIVGGSGFVGRSLARHFARARTKFQVKILDVKPSSSDFEGLPTHVHCDVRDYQETINGVDDVDLVIHAAIVQIPLINEQRRLAYEVNLVGTQNVCKAVDESRSVKGMLLAGSWHTVGERELQGMIDEEFGFRPDKVESRARLYALSKIGQESIVRFYDEMSDKIYGIIRMGTVLGEGMPEKTAANIFIEKGLKGEAITPYKHSMHRPMLYVNIDDICRAFEAYAKKILNNEIEKSGNSLTHIVNVYYPNPITIFELAEIVKESITECTGREVKPKIKIVDKGIPTLFTANDKNRIKVDLSKAKKLLGLEKLTSPRQSILEMVKLRLS